MTKVIMRKQGKALVPSEDDAADLLAKIADGKEVVVDVRQARDLTNLRKWWVLMSILAENMPVIVDKRAASDLVLLSCHEVDWRTDPKTGQTWPQARSIAFENMAEDEFQRLWKRAVYYINAEWLPIGTDKLREEVDMFLSGPQAASLGRRAA